MTTVGFEPTPLRTGALSQRLRPLGQIVMFVQVPDNNYVTMCVYYMTYHKGLLA